MAGGVRFTIDPEVAMLTLRNTLLPALLLSATAFLTGAEQKPAMDPAMLELMKPGPEHQQLDKLVGTWNVDCQSWMAPDTPVMESTAKVVIKPLFDGRFLQEEFTSSHMGQPFTGISTVGYDRVAKQYVSSWIDNMGTGIVYTTGTSDDGGKTITYTGTMSCPMEAKDGKSGTAKVRQIETHQGDDRFTYVMYVNRDGKEYKALSLNYHRAQ
jgi:hypothetical protein